MSIDPDSIAFALPESMQSFVRGQVVAGGYRDAGEYIQHLIRDAQRRAAEEELARLITEGIESGPATEMTSEDWKRIREKVNAGIWQD